MLSHTNVNTIGRGSVLLLLLLAMGFCLFAGSAAASEASGKTQMDVYYVPMTLVFDGQELTPPADQRVFIYENRTYVPMRFLTQALQQGIDWDNATSTATVRSPHIWEEENLSVFQQAHQPAAQVDGDAPTVKTKVTAYRKEIHFVFYGQSKQPDEGQQGMIIDNRLYVPMRFFSEASGAVIDFDLDTYTIQAKSGAMPQPNEKGSESPPVVTDDEQTPSTDDAVSGTDETPVPPSDAGSPPPQPGPAPKPSYDELINEIEDEIGDLKATCEEELWELAFTYIQASANDRQGLVEQGYAALDRCDTRFAALMAEAEADLEDNGYPTGKIDEYRQLYEEEKQAAKVLVEAYL